MKAIHLHSWKCIWNRRLRNGSHFVSASIHWAASCIFLVTNGLLHLRLQATIGIADEYISFIFLRKIINGNWIKIKSCQENHTTKNLTTNVDCEIQAILVSPLHIQVLCCLWSSGYQNVLFSNIPYFSFLSNNKWNGSWHFRLTKKMCMKDPVIKYPVNNMLWYVSSHPLAPYTNIIRAWKCNHTPNKVWGGITYPFLNFNGCTVWGKE